MSIFGSVPRDRDDDRERERNYRGDVFYGVWRSGGNPDHVSYDRVQEHYSNGDESDVAARHELQIQQQRIDRAREEREAEEYQIAQQMEEADRSDQDTDSDGIH